MEERHLESWLVLSYMPGMHSQRFNTLLKQFSSPQAILACKPSELAAKGINAEVCSSIKSWQLNNGRINQRVEKSLTWQQQANRKIVTQACEGYPPILDYIPDPPPLLYIEGSINTVAFPQIAIVGSRKPSPGGRKNARLFAKELGKLGFSICSGMALGIDYESHMGALESNIPTIAVLGSGIDHIYPKQHLSLATNIIAEGAIISEFPLGTLPNAWNFPQRNRIISGLSLGVLVVEAALRSGSLISARFALEQGREVFAIPGSIHNPMTKGCHYLINSGAKLVEKAEDIVAELGALYALVALNKREPENIAKKQSLLSRSSQETILQNLSVNAELLLSEIGYEPITPDSLLASTGLEIAEMNSLLVELEINGRIDSENGGYTLSVP